MFEGGGIKKFATSKGEGRGFSRGGIQCVTLIIIWD
jgi:hypothetical protein